MLPPDFLRVSPAGRGTGIQPPGAERTLADSRPKRRGMLGPVRSMSRTATEWPREARERESCVVTEDLPTPPLPERTWEVEGVSMGFGWWWGGDWRLVGDGMLWEGVVSDFGGIALPGRCA